MANPTKIVTKKSVGNHSTSKSIITYIDNVSTMSNSTANEYHFRLSDFMTFIVNKYASSLDVDSLLIKIKNGSQDPYSILNGYAAYLKNRNVSALTLKQRIVTVKNFFEYCDIDISPRRFKLKIKLPKVVRKKKEALSKGDIIEILDVCDNIRLRTYVMLLAATGLRAVEALSTRFTIWILNQILPSFLSEGNIPKPKSIESYS